MTEAQQLAERVRAEMYQRDPAAQMLGIVVEAIGPGFARCRMTVRADMLNGHDTCHGGLTFSLADAAFAYACNAYNRVTVALGAQITFIAPARAGDVLIATAREQSRAARTGSTTSRSPTPTAPWLPCSAAMRTKPGARSCRPTLAENQPSRVES